ncbi:MAG: Response regulator PleD [Chlamydiae bacterium]|nr:Response regulator PleD [Chlamydiota bacterium]
MKMKPKKLPTLLLITASPTTRAFFEIITDKLEEYALICVSSEIEALDYLTKTFISFIVIDEKTPYVELTPLCEKIRSLNGHRYSPILIITGHLKKTFTRNLIKAGATDFLREPLDEDEFLHRMEMASESMETQQKITTLSTSLSTAAASGISMHERAIMDDRATKIIEVALNEKSALSLLLMEIDQYQKFQKSRGEKAAHALLIDFTEHLQRLIRIQDLLFNQNHGKFALFLPKTSERGSQLIGENIQEYLEGETFSAGSIRFNLTTSIGVATLENAGDVTRSPATNLERLLAAASLCLNRAKETGNCVVSHSKK